MKPKLRIAFVHPDLGIGGAERLIVDAALGMQERGHTVEIFTSHFDPQHAFKETSQLKIRVFGDWLPRHVYGQGHILFSIVRSLLLAMYVLCFRSDVMVVDQISSSIPILKLSGSRILFYCHFPDKLLTNRNSLLKKFYRFPIDLLEEWTTGMADSVVVNSRFTLSVFAGAFPSIGSLPLIIYPGLRFSAYDKRIVIDDDLLEWTLSISSETKIVLSINRFERKKNIELAIRSFALLKMSNLMLVIAGGYDVRVIENVEYLKTLQLLCDELLLTHSTHPNGCSVLFVPSFTENQRTYLFSRASLLVYTPSHEHFGIVPLEAMYAGLPVVAVSNGGPTETIIDGITGFLCESDQSAFASKIKILLNDTQMGVAAREHILCNFGLDRFLDKLEDCLYQTLEEPIGWWRVIVC